MTQSHHHLHRHSPESLVDVAVDRLRAQGERVTAARRDVLRVLAEHHRHLSADEVTAALERRGGPGTQAHRATVYRTLEMFSDAGIVTHRQAPGDATAYHLATDSHLHGHCVRCGEVLALPADAFADSAERLLREAGFALDTDRSVFSGICADCRD